MVRDLAWRASRGLHELPLDWIVRILLQLENAVEVDSPHGGDGSLLQITASVHVQATIANSIRKTPYELDTYNSSSCFLKMNPQWLERRSGSLPCRRTSIHWFSYKATKMEQNALSFYSAKSVKEHSSISHFASLNPSDDNS